MADIRDLFRSLAMRYGWTIEQIRQLTVAQFEMMLVVDRPNGTSGEAANG